MRIQDFVNFVVARHDIYLAKRARRPKPWTTDVILQSYRFCNVYRELDTVTEWIAENWRAPLGQRGTPNLWFWMLLARLVNHPPALAQMTPMTVKDRWDEKLFQHVLWQLQERGDKAWGGAYIVSTNGHDMPKARYVAQLVLGPAWEARRALQPRQHDTLSAFCERLLTLNGVQGFIAGQVIADAKYADEDLLTADDWHTFAISGPGSRRGMNRVLDQSIDFRMKEVAWNEALQQLRLATNKALGQRNRAGNKYPPLHAQDVQNCLCEFDKYERVRLGEGKPRSSYPGA